MLVIYLSIYDDMLSDEEYLKKYDLKRNPFDKISAESMTPDEIIAAISTDNVNVLKAIKGIGAKTAQRIIIDLKDKLGKIAETGQFLTLSDNTIRNESLSALVMLGFAKKDAEKAIEKVLKEHPDLEVESVIKKALKRL